MSDSSVAFTDSLLQDELPRGARCGGKAIVSLAFLVGLGFAALLCNGTMPVTSSGSWTSKEPPINMAWQSTQARPLQSMQPVKPLPFMQPVKPLPFMQPPRASALPGPFSQRNGLATEFRVNALPTPSALAGIGASPNRVPDLRQILRSSPAQKCIYADKHASVCGNLVVLRPSTALRAQNKDGQTQDAESLLNDVAAKLDSIEDKPTAALYAGGALVALVVANGIVGSLDSIPLVPKLMELVGLGYSAWFTYRYLLTKASRDELFADIDSVKEKITR